MTSKTISYYENNAKTFHDRTINVDMLENYQAFLKHLPNNGHILDAGCGVGRDAKFFLKCGYNVTAFDASKEMVKMTTKETGLKALQLTF
jgi:2-polyprenyl-3-methyl-5-hydroxy-6-metoxy-1,4-benzoquinol methylase